MAARAQLWSFTCVTQLINTFFAAASAGSGATGDRQRMGGDGCGGKCAEGQTRVASRARRRQWLNCQQHDEMSGWCVQVRAKGFWHVRESLREWGEPKQVWGRRFWEGGEKRQPVGKCGRSGRAAYRGLPAGASLFKRGYEGTERDEPDKASEEVVRCDVCICGPPRVNAASQADSGGMWVSRGRGVLRQGGRKGFGDGARKGREAWLAPLVASAEAEEGPEKGRGLLRGRWRKSRLAWESDGVMTRGTELCAGRRPRCGGAAWLAEVEPPALKNVRGYGCVWYVCKCDYRFQGILWVDDNAARRLLAR